MNTNEAQIKKKWCSHFLNFQLQVSISQNYPTQQGNSQICPDLELPLQEMLINNKTSTKWTLQACKGTLPPHSLTCGAQNLFSIAHQLPRLVCGC